MYSTHFFFKLAFLSIESRRFTKVERIRIPEPNKVEYSYLQARQERPSAPENGLEQVPAAILQPWLENIEMPPRHRHSMFPTTPLAAAPDKWAT
jgi:hypothetical protein